MTGYTTEEVARLLGLSPAQIRAYTRAGFLSPARGARGDLRFTFQDLVLLRAAKGLMAARIPAARIRGSLRRLKQQLPRGRALSELRITAEGHRVVARDGAVAWNPDSGQLVLDFDVASLAQRAAPLARRQAEAARRAEDDFDAEQWFELGVELEVSAPAEARDAYRRALELEPHHADAHVNLGRLLQEGGRAGEAETHYRAVLADQPDHATAWFNLGVAQEDLRRTAEATKSYERAVAADRRLADAHFNLARLYEQAGKRAAALRHLSKYHLLSGRD
ncbi:MAG TPA: tetratricopeptide repeat protein [Gemmatimonadales bacterium]|nr:tetratricopeptide repeat protein [Gemmatimonadales bacterium]